ncbi:MAG: MFS transporter, partial [Pseudomonadota bacterium]
MKTNALSVSIVFILWLAGLGAAAQFAKIAVPFAAIRATFPNSGDEIGWLLSLISLLGAVFGLIVGDVVGRLGAKRVLVFGLGVGAVISLGQAGGLSFTMLVVSRLFEGASHMAIVVAAPTLISTLCPSRYTGVAMTLWSTFF